MAGMMRLKIGADIVRDISYWGLELIKSPEAYGGSIKDSNIVVTDFPEEHGSRVYIPTTPKKAAYEYTIKFGFYSETDTPASKISAFTDLLVGKTVVIYNDYKDVQLTGYYKSYKDDGLYNGTKVALFDVTFLINNPSTNIFS